MENSGGSTDGVIVVDGGTLYLPGEEEIEGATLKGIERFTSPNYISNADFLTVLSRKVKLSQIGTAKSGLIGKLLLTNFRLRFVPFAFETDPEHRSSLHRRSRLISWFDVPFSNVHSVYLDAKMKHSLQRAQLTITNDKSDDSQADASEYLLVVTYDGRWHPFRLTNVQRRARLAFLQVFADALSDKSFEQSFAYAFRHQLAVENEKHGGSASVCLQDCEDHEATLRKLPFTDRLNVLNALYEATCTKNAPSDNFGAKKDNNLEGSAELDESVAAGVPGCQQIIRSLNRQCSLDSSANVKCNARVALSTPPPTFNNEADWSRELAFADRNGTVRWRVSLANGSYELCKSLPRALVVPASLSDADLRTIATAFVSQRLPVFCFSHRASNTALLCVSEPLQSQISHSARPRARAPAEPQFVRSASTSHERGKRPPRLVVTHSEEQLDENGETDQSCARIEECAAFQKYVNALSSSCKYKVVQVHDLPTVGQIREAHEKLTGRCVAVPLGKQAKHDDDWYTTVNNTNWLCIVSAVLKRANECANLLRRGLHVFLAEPVSTDRCLLVAALTELLVEPRARTLRGFQTTVQRTFVALGHPFRSRSGRRNSSRSNGSIASQSSMASLWQAGKKSAKQHVQSLLSLASYKGRRSLPVAAPARAPTNSHFYTDGFQNEQSRETEASADGASPVFLLFLDCVHQMIAQTPNAFEFSEDLLVVLADAYTCGLFDEFLFDCMQHAHDLSLLDADGFYKPRCASNRDSDCESTITTNSYCTTPLRKMVSVWNWSLQFSVDEQLHFVNPAYLVDRVRETVSERPSPNSYLKVCPLVAALRLWSLYFERFCGPLCFPHPAVRYAQLRHLRQHVLNAMQKQARKVEQLIKNCETSTSQQSCCALSACLLREVSEAEIRSIWLQEALQSVEQHCLIPPTDDTAIDAVNETHM